jgi:transposase-like protein
MVQRQVRQYDREFKLNAVKLYRDSKKGVTELSRDLGIPPTTLWGWVKEFEANGEDSFQGSGKIKPCNADIAHLLRELANVKQERDILKKAVAIFSRAKV